VTGKTWGPRSTRAAIGWWADRLRAIERGVRGSEDGAPFSVPKDRFRVVMLDELVGSRREREYASLLEFLGLEDEPSMREFFDREMTVEAAHVGRWRRGVPLPARAMIQRRYVRTIGRLEREGNHVAPILRAALEHEAQTVGLTGRPLKDRSQP
jgi:hypothetical protein